jgi:hypothetical protein
VSSRASGASLEVFRPLQRSLAAPRSILRRAAGPADKPASALPRDTRALSRGGPVSRNSPLRVCAVVSGRDVEVLGVADERGWAFRPDRDQRVGRCPGRRPLAGSRRRNDRVVRGRPVDPEPSHSRPTRPHASAAASHPPPTPGHAPPLSLARCSATRISRPCNARPGRTSWSFPRPVRRRSWGSVRSALRRFAPADGWCTRFRATGPACRSCRRHPPD